MAYTTQDAIESEVGANNIIQFCADEGERTEEEITARLNSIISVSDNAVDSYLAGVYDVPISPVAPVCSRASLIFACEILYRRRLSPTEKNPYTDEADRLREQLTKIGNRDLPLSADVTPNFSQGAVNGRASIYGTWGSNSLGNSM